MRGTRHISATNASDDGERGGALLCPVDVEPDQANTKLDDPTGRGGNTKPKRQIGAYGAKGR